MIIIIQDMNNLDEQEKRARFKLINKLIKANPYFSYLLHLSTPTNNALKYSNQVLKQFALAQASGGIFCEESTSALKELYMNFVKDYEQFGYKEFIRQQQYGQIASGRKCNQKDIDDQLIQIQVSKVQFMAPTVENDAAIEELVAIIDPQEDTSKCAEKPRQFTNADISSFVNGFIKKEDPEQLVSVGLIGERNPISKSVFGEQKYNFRRQCNFQDSNKIHRQLNAEIRGYEVSRNIAFPYDKKSNGMFAKKEYNVHNAFESNLRRLSERQVIKRHQLISQLIEANPYYSYLFQVQNPTNNHLKYTNYTLERFIFEIDHVNFNSKNISSALEQLYYNFMQQYDASCADLLYQKALQQQKQQIYNFRQCEEVKMPLFNPTRFSPFKSASVSNRLQKRYSNMSKYNTSKRQRSLWDMKKKVISPKQRNDGVRGQSQYLFFTIKGQNQQSRYNQIKNRKEIVNVLNQIKWQNLMEIESMLTPFVIDNVNTCNIVIDQIIKMAEQKPKDSPVYAKLCLYLTNKPAANFHFGSYRSGEFKLKNPFRILLMEFVQNSLKQAIAESLDIRQTDKKDCLSKQNKIIIINNLRLICQLIQVQVLKKKTIRYCLSQLFKNFLINYYVSDRSKKIGKKRYDFYFQALVKFIRGLGGQYDMVEWHFFFNQKTVADGRPDQNVFWNHFTAIINKMQIPNIQILEYLQSLNGIQYLHILKQIEIAFIRKNHPKLSQLYNSLLSGRNKQENKVSVTKNKLSVSKNKLPVSKNKKDPSPIHTKRQFHSLTKQVMKDLAKDVDDMLKSWEKDMHRQVFQINKLLRIYGGRNVYTSYMNQLARVKKERIIRRFQLFPIILNHNFSVSQFRVAWFQAIKKMALVFHNHPFCAAALAKIMWQLLAEKGKLSKYFTKFEDEDENVLMEDIFQNYYMYSQDKRALKFIQPKQQYQYII